MNILTIDIDTYNCVKGGLIDFMRGSKKYKKKVEDKLMEEWGKGSNIKHHYVNPQWNYTISPRPVARHAKKDKK